MKNITVSLEVDLNDPEDLAEVSEQFARTLAGLSMRGIFGEIVMRETVVYLSDDADDMED